MTNNIATDQWLLRAMRTYLGLNQKQLGRVALITQPFISLYETGRQRPSAAEEKRLVDAIVKLVAGKELERFARELRT